MKKYTCEYRATHKLDLGREYTKVILADTPEEAYETFLQEIGSYPQKVYVEYDLPSGLVSTTTFDKHIEESHKEVFQPLADKLGSHDKLSTDEKILMELIKANKKLSNLKWLLFAIAIMIFVTLRMGL